MNAHRWKELLAISMIGEGTLATFFPREHLALWHVGPGALQATVRFCEKRPGFTRLLAAAEAGVGIWLAYRQFDRDLVRVRPISEGKGKPLAVP
ncbi:MAG TPA: hypothetical protein VFG04_30415 [Planctomycetaceae bacterium]|jgi:hypothetical protein|nr:hypothetical protein [Planctomycetaceae bacterium]